jgi:hypothetical protein
MRASGYAPLAALLILLASPAESEIIKLKCVDAHGVPVVQYVIDTHRQRVDQVLAGGRIAQPAVTSITETYVRFIDRSGDAATNNRLNRATGELTSEIMEGPERGISLYLNCRRSDE